MSLQAVFKDSHPDSRSFLNHTGWALADQAIVSFGMLAANIILARHLPSSEYGVFVLLLTVGFSAQLLTQGLSGYPLILRLAHASDDERARLLTNSIVPLALWSLGQTELIVPGVTWFAFWQMQQATRRALLIELRQRDAAKGDAVSSLGQVVFLLLLFLLGSRILSLESALYCMAAGSMLGATIQALQLRLARRALYRPYQWLINNASLVLSPLAAAVIWTLRGYAMFWLLAALSGTPAVASLQAALTVFNLCNPLSASLVNIIGTTSARAFTGGDIRQAWSAARPYVLVALPPLLLYLGTTLLFPRFLLSVLYGQGSPYAQLGYLFPYLAVSTAAVIPAELLTSFFLGIRQTGLVLKINLLGVTAVAFSTPLLLSTYGLLEGTCLALAGGEVVRLTFLLLCLRQLIENRGASFSKVQSRLASLQEAWQKASR